jgi:geranylgeranyl pyrophosphate synthase
VTTLSPETWAAQRAEEVCRRAETIVRRSAASDEQRALVDTALLGLRADAGAPFSGPIHMPLLVHAALRRDDRPAEDLAVAFALLNLSLHILDDLEDGDLPRHWVGYRPADIGLIASVVLGWALPQLVLSGMDVSSTTRAALQRTLAIGLLEAAAGQQADLAAAGTDRPDPAAVERSIGAKSGSRRAMYAAMAAQLAGASEEHVAVYTRLGRAMGMASQLASDISDLFAADDEHPSSDLANGTRTLPIAIRLWRLPGADRAQFLALLERARTDLDAQANVRSELLEHGVLRRCLFQLEIYRQRALRCLDEASGLEPARGRLRAMIDAVSPFAL